MREIADQNKLWIETLVTQRILLTSSSVRNKLLSNFYVEEYGFGPELSLGKLPRHSFDEFDKRQTYVNYDELLKIDKRCTKHAQVF